MRAYLIALLGPKRGGPAGQRALDELAGLAHGAAAPDAAVVRKVVEAAGLDGLDAEARRLSRRMGIVGHARCRRVGRRLRARTDGTISARELNAFYLHLERCERCSAVASRLDAAQWFLQTELGAVRRTEVGEVAPTHVVPPVVEAPPAAASPVWEPAPPPRPAASPVAEPAPLPRPAASPVADPGPPADNGPVRREAAGRRPRRGLQLVVLAAVAIAVAAVVLLPGKSAPKQPPTTAPSTTRPSTTGPSTTGPSTSGSSTTTRTITARADGTPFVVDGERFAGFVNPSQRWTAFARTVPPAGGDRWLLIVVRTRNLTRPTFDPRLLSYRLIGAGGVHYFPNSDRGTGANVPRPTRPSGPGTLIQAELAFQVPSAARGQVLVFDPSGPGGARVVMTLGN